MTKPPDEFMTDERTTAYLLQELTEPEAEKFEEQCFAQDEWPSVDLESIEQDLIQAYIRKELSPERERRFEENYLTTAARRERVLLARSFLRVVCSPQKLTWGQRFKIWVQQLRASWNALPLVPKYTTAAVLALGMMFLLWSLLPPAPPRTFANLNLTIASERRANEVPTAPTQRVLLPLGADALRIVLTLPEPTPEGSTYRAEWEDVKGPIKTLEIESQTAGSVSVVIPAKDLLPGQYVLKLIRKNQDGTEHRIKGSYFFEVV